MRIAFISYEYPPESCNGGIATYAGQATRVLANRGHEVEVYASTPLTGRTEDIQGILVHWINELDGGIFPIKAGHQFANRHAERPFDVLEAPEFNAEGRVAKILAPEVPLVVKMHTPSLILVQQSRMNSLFSFGHRQVGNLKHLISNVIRRRRLTPWNWDDLERAYAKDQLEAEYTRSANLVAPPCVALREFAEKVWRVDPQKIRLTPYPFIPTQEFLQLAPRDNSNVVGFVGRLERKKGVETLARAIPIVCRAFPSVQFRFVGSVGVHRETQSNYDQWLRTQVSPYENHLEFVGKVPLAQMARAYSELDICVFPSLWENFPNVCLEAMSAGRAIVGSTQGGMVDMLDNGTVGLLADPADAKAVAGAILTLLENPALRVELGKKARQRILDCYSESVIGSLMEKLYEEAIQSR